VTLDEDDCDCSDLDGVSPHCPVHDIINRADLAALRLSLAERERESERLRAALGDIEQAWQDRSLDDAGVIGSVMEIVKRALNATSTKP
jgi:hypothetical protein